MSPFLQDPIPGLTMARLQNHRYAKYVSFLVSSSHVAPKSTIIVACVSYVTC